MKDRGNKRVIYHEMVHIKQQKREPVVFYFKYLYYLHKYGYKSNPYEVEARVETAKAFSHD